MNIKLGVKNLETRHGIKFYKRWTVLDVKASTVEKIKKYSKDNRVAAGKALDELVEVAYLKLK